MPEIPTTEPNRFIQGDTVQWTKELTDYPADDGWALTYAFVKDDDQQTVTAVADGSDHAATITAAESAVYGVGIYHWQAYATKAGARYTIAEGYVEVLANFATAASGYDARSHYRKVLDALHAALEGRASQTQLSYTVNTPTGSRSVQHMSHEDLIAAIRRYEGLVAAEARPQDGKSGNRGRITARFT